MDREMDHLSRKHIARLRQYVRYSDGLGQIFESPLDDPLLAHGLITRGAHPPGWIATEKGWQADERYQLQARELLHPHNDLAARVAQWLETQNRMAWLNRTFEVKSRNTRDVARHLGLLRRPDPLATAGAESQRDLEAFAYTARPDVISIVRSTRPNDLQPWVFEVKVSRKDFYRDVDNPIKRLAYALLAERVYYVCPEHLVDANEVPGGCGLVVETRGGSLEIRTDAPRRTTRHRAHIRRLLG